MKLSVIFGVFHMSMGIIIKGTNAIYFRKWAVLICEVFAGFIILFALFGWMDILIFLKWFYIAIFPSWLSGLILYLYKSKAWPRAM